MGAIKPLQICHLKPHITPQIPINIIYAALKLKLLDIYFISESSLPKPCIELRPVLLTVDDDLQVVRAIERDLRHQYGKRFRILKAESAHKALRLVKLLKLRNEVVALFLVDQRMPQMSGVELLEQTIDIFPEAKRVLLTAYADTEAAIRSINKARIDYYLMKPWDPPAEHLYPILDDLLDDWYASFRPPYEGIRVIGLRWSPKSYEVKHFLARNGIPYQ